MNYDITNNHKIECMRIYHIIININLDLHCVYMHTYVYLNELMQKISHDLSNKIITSNFNIFLFGYSSKLRPYGCNFALTHIMTEIIGTQSYGG